MTKLADWCFRHRRIVVVFWLLALIVTAGASKQTGTKFSTSFSLPHTQSAQALNLLEKEFPAAYGSSDQIVLHAKTGTLRDPATQAAAEAMLAKVATLPDIRAVVSPFTAAGVKQISANSEIAFATIIFAQTTRVPAATVERVIHTAQAAGSSSLQVELGGNDIENAIGTSSSGNTAVGAILALAVLGIAFGALFAAFLPLATALIAIGIGYSLTSLLTHVLSIAPFAPILGVLIGLGVGVDYALLIVTRHRASLKSGHTPHDATVHAVNTAGRAVFFAGLTVCIALLGQFALGLSFFYGPALTASLTVLLTMGASLTLLPALLGFTGERVLSRRQRRKLRETGPVDEVLTGTWYRWATWISKGPWIAGLAGLIVAVIIALPVFSIHLGIDDAGSDPSGTTTLAAYDLIEQGFGPGFSGPLQLVGVLDQPSDAAAFGRIVDTLNGQPGVVSVSAPVTSPNGKVAIANLYPTTTPQSVATDKLVNRLRKELPKTAAGTGVTVLVGGSTAITDDFVHLLSGKLIPFIAVIVLLGFILLMAVFRSLLVPLVASLMNLLSAGAALGIMNVVFEWGWGHSLFQVSEKVPVFVFIPVLMISVLFGLSMDYEVFLVSRIHEEWVHRGDNEEAVTLGQAATGRVITAAATIMILVFASFAFGGQIIIKQFGVGLAGAIIIDAFIVRTLVVPSIMHICGKANWWLPGWLDRILPQLNVEGSVPSDPAPEPVPTGVAG